VEAVDYRQCDFTGPSALVLGAEKWGLSAEAAALVDQPIVIPMHGMVQSLNVSVACATLLFEALRQRQAAGLLPRPIRRWQPGASAKAAPIQALMPRGPSAKPCPARSSCATDARLLISAGTGQPQGQAEAQQLKENLAAAEQHHRRGNGSEKLLEQAPNVVGVGIAAAPKCHRGGEQEQIQPPGHGLNAAAC
jgi:hypothetical protein